MIGGFTPWGPLRPSSLQEDLFNIQYLTDPKKPNTSLVYEVLY